MVALVGMQGVYGATDGPSVIAATLIGSAPTLLLFLFLQRYFVRGLSLGVGRGDGGEARIRGQDGAGHRRRDGDRRGRRRALRRARRQCRHRRPLGRRSRRSIAGDLTERGGARDRGPGRRLRRRGGGGGGRPRWSRAFGGIDIVSNNAGIQRYGTVETTSEAEWDEVIDVNLKKRLPRLPPRHPPISRPARRDRQHGLGAVLRHPEGRRGLHHRQACADRADAEHGARLRRPMASASTRWRRAASIRRCSAGRWRSTTIRRP